MSSIIYILFICFIRFSLSQKDPLKDFCRIYGHQTTLVDRKLYIDGGLVNWAPLSADSINYTSTWLRNGDLDVENEGFPQESLLTKNDTIPSVHGGVLWSDATNKILYQFGGEYGNDKPEDFRLWYYDIVYNTWNMSNVSTTDIRRASWGAGVAVEDRGRGYYYGGWLTNSSVPGYHSRTALKNMLVYDMVGNSFRNQSGPDDIPRAEGVMVYLPVGDGGFLVYFGGVQLPYGNDTIEGVPMTEIYLYDIANDVWYKETASGVEVPENRRRFCAGATWADDHSSYNIYLFGGASIGDGVGYGDVWVLSLPSFTWIKFWPRAEDNIGATFPHHSLTCDVIENAQMIIMGGSFPNLTSECDVPTIYGQHGLDLGKANAKGAKWAEFDPKLTTYKVPSEIAQTIGGGATGGATVLAPTSGWAQRDLQVEFTRIYTPTTRTPTRYIPAPTESTPSATPAPGGSNKKTIIGAAVGGGIGALLIVFAVGACLYIRRRKKSEEDQPRPPSELPSQSMAHITSPSAHQGSFHTPSTQYMHTPQGSPPPPSARTWSHLGDADPEYAYSQHQRNPSDHSYNPSIQSSPVGFYKHAPGSPTIAAQEMPVVRSPPALNVQPETQTLNISEIDPYFAQHPPRGAEDERSPKRG